MSASSPRLAHWFRFLIVTAALFVALAVGQASVSGQASDADKKAERGPAEFAGLKYRSLGPAWGGRVSRAVGV
ncbi:MAG: hypothetical protein H6Q08_2801, partial [Acidobacteria bacterium]|nr:hypothetical protein [Acidobacteriota bacterium]